MSWRQKDTIMIFCNFVDKLSWFLIQYSNETYLLRTKTIPQWIVTDWPTLADFFFVQMGKYMKDEWSPSQKTINNKWTSEIINSSPGKIVHFRLKINKKWARALPQRPIFMVRACSTKPPFLSCSHMKKDKRQQRTKGHAVRDGITIQDRKDKHCFTRHDIYKAFGGISQHHFPTPSSPSTSLWPSISSKQTTDNKLLKRVACVHQNYNRYAWCCALSPNREISSITLFYREVFHCPFK